MEQMTFKYFAREPVLHRAHIGVVASGDLEILLEPSQNQYAYVMVRTSVTGYRHIWEAILNRFFASYKGAVVLTIDDFGATPGVVKLRLRQVVEASTSS